MVIYLYGPDSYRRQQKASWYLEEFKKKHSGLTIEYFDCSEKSGLDSLRSFVTAQSLFADAKLGVLENVAEAEPKDLKEAFTISSASKILTLIISVDKALKKDFKVPVEKPNIALEFKEVTGATLAAFARAEADKRGLKLTQTVLDSLINNYGGDEWGLITELDKLSLGASAEPFLGSHDFFSLAGALQADGPASYKLPALERLLIDNDAASIFNFVASRAGSALKTKMADFDSAIKSGKSDYEEALFALALN